MVIIFSPSDYGGADEYEGSGGSDAEGCDHSDDEDCYSTGGSGDGGASAADGSGDGQSDVDEDVMKSAKGGQGQEYDPYHPPLPTPAPPVENSLDNSSQKGKSLLQITFGTDRFQISDLWTLIIKEPD